MLTIETLPSDRLARLSPALLTALIEQVWLLAAAWPDTDLAVTTTPCGLALTVSRGDQTLAGHFLPFAVAPCVTEAA